MNKIQKAQKCLWENWRKKKQAEGWQSVCLFIPGEMVTFIRAYVAENKPKYIKGKGLMDKATQSELQKQ